MGEDNILSRIPQEYCFCLGNLLLLKRCGGIISSKKRFTHCFYQKYYRREFFKNLVRASRFSDENQD